MKVDPPVRPTAGLAPSDASRMRLRDHTTPNPRVDAPRSTPASRSPEAEVVRIRPATIDLSKLSVADFKAELTDLMRQVDGPAASRDDRARAWILRGELRKLDVLDGFLGGYIRG